MVGSDGELSVTMTLVVSFETEVVIPNCSKYRTNKIVLAAAGTLGQLQAHCFSIFSGLERQSYTRPVAVAGRR